MKARGGFTLLELLMVVIIISILASLALPQYLKGVKKARRAEALNTLAQLRSAVLRYQAENSACPAATTNIAAAPLDAVFPNSTASWDFEIKTSCVVSGKGNGTALVNTCVMDMNADGSINDSAGIKADGTGC